ncbi:hypothetical protein BC938DRAFT_482933 [Jimgerdemannia flammicorona]|uniref:Uncharacterized protein n=1 Tax=Jimgerdemannia flammicorona TaxID=994334 RepID=A0A433QCX5_9FUNG|nr:hypothetical protein BC938DRAFT_482933 [Jimgerdemannia flammicorona]
MSCQDRDTIAALPIPDADRLIVGGADNPGILVVEEDGADVIQMAVEREEASTRLVIPDFDLVVIATAHEKWLGRMERDAANGAYNRCLKG